MVVTAILSMVSHTATAAMILPLAMGILSKIDQEKEHNTCVFMLLGIADSASIVEWRYWLGAHRMQLLPRIYI